MACFGLILGSLERTLLRSKSPQENNSCNFWSSNLHMTLSIRSKVQIREWLQQAQKKRHRLWIKLHILKKKNFSKQDRKLLPAASQKDTHRQTHTHTHTYNNDWNERPVLGRSTKKAPPEFNSFLSVRAKHAAISQCINSHKSDIKSKPGN